MKTLSMQSLCAAALCALFGLPALAQTPSSTASTTASGTAPAATTPTAKVPKMQCYLGSTTATTRCPAVLKYSHVVRQAGAGSLPLVGKTVSIEGTQAQPALGPYRYAYAKDASLPLRMVCPAPVAAGAALNGQIVKSDVVGQTVVLVLDRCDA